jgi:hypothetical protein
VNDHHLRTAHALADVPWLERSRRAYAAWYLRLAGLIVGCAGTGAVLEADTGTAVTLAAATVGLAVAGAALLAGATYGRIVGALSGALAAGHAPHWLAARIRAHEGAPRQLAAELEGFAGRQPA